ncbi:MAG: cusB [Chitinophagaceae bacterium]|nr:cusB [Chitinophagaceae bacterium]
MRKLSSKNKVLSIFLFPLIIALLIAGCEEKKEQDTHAEHDHTTQQQGVKVYTCPMHPEIIRNEPGPCPICGMDLVEKGVTANTDALNHGTVIEPVNETIIRQAKITSPVNKKLSSTVDTKGYITYNPKNTSAIAARYSGRIDKLYVRYNFQEVTKGQKIMDVYSPELITAQQDYVFLLDKQEEAMLQAAKQKLLLLGMNETQIQHLQKTKKAEYLVSIYAPASGHIHQMNSSDQLIMPVMPLNEVGQMNTNNTEFTIREGTYIKKGESIFNIISLSQVWVILKIYPEDVNKIKVGQSVEITSEIAPENPIQAKISFVEPVLDNDSKFLSVRVYLEKSDHHVFKIGSLVSGKINTGELDGLWIPSSSMLDLGNATYVVFKKEGQHFKTQKITASNRINNEINVLEGLSMADTIATDAWYMIDSESFVLTK